MNNVQLIGRLVRDIEMRYTPSGTASSQFTLAVDRKMSKEKRAEAERNNQPTADFISCKAWSKTAEILAQYVKKGQRIAIEGSIQTGSYEKDGRRIYTTDVLVNSFEFIEKAGAGNEQLNPDGFFPIDNQDIPF